MFASKLASKMAIAFAAQLLCTCTAKEDLASMPDVCSSSGGSRECDPVSALLDQQLLQIHSAEATTAKTTCREWYDAGATTSGMYSLVDANGGVYSAKCDMEDNGGGWTLFATIQSRTGLTCSGGDFMYIPESTEFVDTCNGDEWIFSRAAMIASGGMLMAREVNAPHKTFLVDWLFDGSSCTGDKFFKIVTGDYKGDNNCHPNMYDFTSNAWVPSGDGWCNTNSHSQFNCVAEAYGTNNWPSGAKGLRFHWGSRETNNDGGGVNQIWDWWTGWTSTYGSSSDLVDNFDSWTGTTNGAVELFYKASGAPSPTPGPTPAPTPAPATTTTTSSAPATTTTTQGVLQGAPANAVGDPHLTNVLGQRFDLTQPGKHVFILIPKGADAQDTLLRVDADIEHIGNACADMYIQYLNITGKWADEQRIGGYHYYAQEDAGRMATNWMHVGEVDLKVVWGHTIEGIKYMNLFAKKLGHTGFPVGGLLGEDDHTIASSPNPSCEKAISLITGAPQVHGGSTARADFS